MPDGADDIVGGVGVANLATYVSRDGDVTYTGQDNLANDGETTEGDNVRSDVEWFYGSAGDDELTGTDNLLGEYNDLRGMMGDDRVFALAGNDWLDSHGSWGKDQSVRGCGQRSARRRRRHEGRGLPSMAGTTPTAAATAGSNATAN